MYLLNFTNRKPLSLWDKEVEDVLSTWLNENTHMRSKKVT